jgi:adenylate kinase family enzyme
MQRILILGRGGSGKTTLALRLGALTGIPVTQLDKLFWKGFQAMPPASWIALQGQLIAPPSWILDGDFGPYDTLAPRLQAADTIILMDFGFFRCAWQAFRRSPQRAAFWRWLRWYRRQSQPQVLAAIADFAPRATLLRFSHPRSVTRFLAFLTPVSP